MSGLAKFLVLFFGFVLVLSVFSFGLDSDGDGVLDDFDNCPGTNPNEKLPIILRNPEFLGCSCSQIFELMRDEYCVDVYCFPGKPLEIRNRAYSSRSDPCPPSECVDGDLFEYVVDGEIRCHRGEELPYECVEVVTENADVCVSDGVLDFEEDEVVKDDVFSLIVDSYFDDSDFVGVLDFRNYDELVSVHEVVSSRVSVERVVEFSERVINNRSVFVMDVSLVVEPDSYFVVDDFVFVERIIGDLSNRNVVVGDALFFDEEDQLIVWSVDSLNEKTVFSYRITPGYELDFDFVVQGDVRNLVFGRLLLPIVLLIVIVGFVVFFIINLKNKNEVFKN